ncbi:hypothetical protein Scep_016120 [Stephania cephalantha]|uniref:Fe2OG dioxygenase domain-containing protein n=1 Tax=Stephania cephalantha TaxID=152367 RepID=A0AAP0NSB2_9MAGN
MSSSRREIGGSLPVENVQELASTKELNSVPDRYVRPELAFDVVCVDDDSLKIPVIDLTRLNDDQQFAHEELAKLHHACENWGFFQLINHGVCEDVIEKMKDDTKEFFKLPLEKKRAYAQLPNSIEGYGQAFVVSEEQKLDWGDMLFYRLLPVNERNMRLWPIQPLLSDQYAAELKRVALVLFGLLAKNLGLEPEKLTDHFKNGSQGVRMNYYPPSPQADKVLGISPHSDADALTLLVQVNQVQGLQIRRGGIWVPVEPISGALIVNIGDIIESIEHRVVVNSKEERLSIAAFHSSSSDVNIGPIPDLVKENDPNYITIMSNGIYKSIEHRAVVNPKEERLSIEIARCCYWSDSRPFEGK